MAESTVTQGIEVGREIGKLKRELTLLPLFGLVYFTVCGGSFGVEPLVGLSGPGLTLILFAITPLIFSIPNMLMVREMNSMMPTEGGYYHWVKQAFGPFVGFMAGWMNWVMSWVDVSIYPVLAAYYLSYFFPSISSGIQVLGVEIPGSLISWLVALALIWAISLLNVGGARTAGITANWVGGLMMVPLVLMSIFGIIVWIRDGGPAGGLPMLPPGENLVGALSTGLFVVMWNFMGWELPSVAAGEIVNPRRTYPLAMALALVAAIATYALPTVGGLYGGAGDNGRYLLWGAEEPEEGVGIGAGLAEYGVEEDQITAWGANPQSSVGWEFPQVAHAIGEKFSGQTNGMLSYLLGSLVTMAAVLSMVGLFIGNSLGGTRVPFAMAEDGMMPKFLVKVHPRYGTPWVSIIFCGILYSIFSLNAFAFLIVVDVFLNALVLLLQFGAMWRLRFTHPKLDRDAVPGGFVGLTLVTLGPVAIFSLAVYSQVMEEGMQSLQMALLSIVVGALLYLPIRRYIKRGVPDIDPFKG